MEVNNEMQKMSTDNEKYFFLYEENLKNNNE